MPISSDVLFHFTIRLENLESILTSDFRPHFSLENLNVIMPDSEHTHELEFAIPMVSFCDIPLSQTIQHMEVYGSYGIGLSKEWGKSRGVCPVLYTVPHSFLALKLRSLIENISDIPGTSASSNELLDDFHDATCYIKPYEGKVILANGDEATVRFYDEREWRYVASLPTESFRYGLDKEGFNDQSIRQKANDHLWSQDRLEFVPNDIKYLIVKSEDEILELIMKVEAIKKPRYSPDEIKLLTSRIISAERIQSDL